MDEFLGTSLAMAVTCILYWLSTRTTLPIGSALPNRAFASDSVRMIELGSFKAVSMLPFTNGKVNIFRKSGSTNVPFFWNLVLPTMMPWLFSQSMRDTLFTSG